MKKIYIVILFLLCISARGANAQNMVKDFIERCNDFKGASLVTITHDDLVSGVKSVYGQESSLAKSKLLQGLDKGYYIGPVEIRESNTSILKSLLEKYTPYMDVEVDTLSLQMYYRPASGDVFELVILLKDNRQMAIASFTGKIDKNGLAEAPILVNLDRPSFDKKIIKDADSGYTPDGRYEWVKPSQPKSQQRYILFIENGLLGVKNEKDEIFIKPEYTSIDPLPACDFNLHTLDETGMHGKPQSNSIYDKKNWLVIQKDSLKGLVDEFGYKVLNVEYDDIFYSDDVKSAIIVKKNGMFGLADISGKMLLLPVYKNKEDLMLMAYRENLYSKKDDIFMSAAHRNDLAAKQKKEAVTNNKKQEYRLNNNRKFLYENGKIGLTDEDGNVVLPVEYSEIVPFRNYPGNYLMVQKDSKVGLVNEDGDVVLPPEYSNIVPFRNFPGNYLMVQRDGKVGLADEDGDVVLPVEYSNIIPYRNFPGNHLMIQKNGKVGLADEDGDMVLPVIYNNIVPFTNYSGNYLMIQIDGKVGLADEDGDMVLPAEYNNIVPFRNFPGNYLMVQKNGKVGLADEDGDEVLPAEYNNIVPFRNYPENYLMVQKNGKVGMVDDRGDVILSIEYDNITPFKEIPGDHLLVQKGNFVGLADSDGNIWVDVKYKNIQKKGKQLMLTLPNNKMILTDY